MCSLKGGEPTAVDDPHFTRLSQYGTRSRTALGPELRIHYPPALATVWLTDPPRDREGLLAPRVVPPADRRWDHTEVRLALQLAEAPPPGPVYPEPLDLAFPALSRLSTAQRRWYAHWRAAWLDGWTGRVSPSYVYLAAYHLIGGLWLDDLLRALDALERLAREYPQTSADLLRWAADLAWELGLDDYAVALYGEVDDRIAAAITGRPAGDRAQVRRAEVEAVIRHHAAPNAHLAQHQAELDALCHEAAADGDAYFAAQVVGDLFSALGSPLTEAERVHPYPTVPRYRVVRVRPIALAQRRAFPDNPAFGAFLRALENRHRQAVGRRARLKVSGLPPEVERFIAERHATWPTLAALRAASPPAAARSRRTRSAAGPAPRQAVPPPLQLDRARIDALAAEAEAARTLVADFLGVSEAAPTHVLPAPTDAAGDDWSLDAFLDEDARARTAQSSPQNTPDSLNTPNTSDTPSKIERSRHADQPA